MRQNPLARWGRTPRTVDVLRDDSAASATPSAATNSREAFLIEKISQLEARLASLGPEDRKANHPRLHTLETVLNQDVKRFRTELEQIQKGRYR